MTDIHVGDLVVINSDPSVIGEVLATTAAVGGLHPVGDLDLRNTSAGPQYADTCLLPVRLNIDDGWQYRAVK